MPPKKKAKVEPELVVGKLTRLPKHAGSKVALSLKPKKKANYTAYQNIVVKIGKDEYKYSEAWSMGAKGAVYDLFSVPKDLRDQVYFSDAKVWLEKGGVDPSSRSPQPPPTRPHTHAFAAVSTAGAARSVAPPPIHS